MVRLLRPKEESRPESNGCSPMARDRPTTTPKQR